MAKKKLSGREVLIALCVKFNFDWDAIYHELTHDTLSQNQLEQINIDGFKDYTTMLDVEYPDAIRTQDKPPFVLFIKRNEWAKARKGA